MNRATNPHRACVGHTMGAERSVEAPEEGHFRRDPRVRVWWRRESRRVWWEGPRLGKLRELEELT